MLVLKQSLCLCIGLLPTSNSALATLQGHNHLYKMLRCHRDSDLSPSWANLTRFQYKLALYKNKLLIRSSKTKRHWAPSMVNTQFPSQYSWPLNNAGIRGVNSPHSWKSAHNLQSAGLLYLQFLVDSTNLESCSTGGFTIGKKAPYKWNLAVKTCAVQGSTPHVC